MYYPLVIENNLLTIYVISGVCQFKIILECQEIYILIKETQIEQGRGEHNLKFCQDALLWILILFVLDYIIKTSHTLRRRKNERLVSLRLVHIVGI